jgi:hypothetical protein
MSKYTEDQLEAGLSYEGLRALAVYIVLGLGKRIPMEFKSREDMVERMRGTTDLDHEMLVEAHDDMVKQGVPPSKRVDSLINLGWQFVEGMIEEHEARRKPTHYRD